jgi:hypothetical protein
MMSRANPVGCNALPPKAAADPVATKLKDDIASAGISSLVNDNNKMLAGKMSQTKTAENVGTPLWQRKRLPPHRSRANLISAAGRNFPRASCREEPPAWREGLTWQSGIQTLAKKPKHSSAPCRIEQVPEKLTDFFRKAPAPTY